MNISESNILLAEFLGYKKASDSYWYKEGKPPLTILLFDTSWDWLMEVVEKIFNISLELDSMEMYYNITDSIPNIYHAYQSCVEFVKWYNTQK